MSDSFSLPETLVQLGEQALQPLSWTPLTWVLVLTLAITLGVRRTVLMYFPFVTMKRLRKIADRTDEALGRYKNTLMGGGGASSWLVANPTAIPSFNLGGNGWYMGDSEQWKVFMDYEERVMKIQDIILDISLEIHLSHNFFSSAHKLQDHPLSVRRIASRMWRIAACYRALRKLRNEIQISENMSKRAQLHWGLQLHHMRHTQSDSQDDTLRAREPVRSSPHKVENGCVANKLALSQSGETRCYYV